VPLKLLLAQRKSTPSVDETRDAEIKVVVRKVVAKLLATMMLAPKLLMLVPRVLMPKRANNKLLPQMKFLPML
jgi:hypothetical protein